MSSWETENVWSSKDLTFHRKIQGIIRDRLYPMYNVLQCDKNAPTIAEISPLSVI